MYISAEEQLHRMRIEGARGWLGQEGRLLLIVGPEQAVLRALSGPPLKFSIFDFFRFLIFALTNSSALYMPLRLGARVSLGHIPGSRISRSKNVNTVLILPN